jgi:lysophospholipase L1-like esterase
LNWVFFASLAPLRESCVNKSCKSGRPTKLMVAFSEKCPFFFVLLGIFQAISLHAAEPFSPWRTLFRPGTQIVFVGDSITHGFSAPGTVKGDHYHGLLQVYFATRFPTLDLWTANAGRAGDNLTGLTAHRMDSRDVYKTLPGVVDFPKVAFILYGMNDGGSLGYIDGQTPSESAKEKRRKAYVNNLTEAIVDLSAKNVTPVVLSPTFYDEAAKKNVKPAIGYNTELAIYKSLAQQVATRHDLLFVDLHTRMTERNAFKQRMEPGFSYTNDRVHPHSGGAAIMFYSILNSLRSDPDVFRVHIQADSSAPTVVTAIHTTLRNLKVDDTTLTWTAEEIALPFPINATVYRYDQAFADVPFVSQFNQQWLQVTGLPESSFKLTIDENFIATFTSEDLAAGTDLSQHHTTPQYREALAVRERLFRKQTIDIIKRDLNSTRLNMEGYYRSDPTGRDSAAYANLMAEDWDHPNTAKILGYLDRQIQEMNDTKRALGNFFSHISKQTHAYLPEIVKLNAELTIIRAETMALPAVRTYRYRLSAFNENESTEPSRFPGSFK